MSRQLASGVIPNEYGITPQGKLRIGSRIASEVGHALLVRWVAHASEMGCALLVRLVAHR